METPPLTPVEVLMRFLHISISIFTVIILINIWLFYYRKTKRTLRELDLGIVFLCCGLLSWAALGALHLNLHYNDIIMPVHFRLALSLLNSTFLLMSFPFFDHSDFRIDTKIGNGKWILASIATSLFFYFVSGYVLLFSSLFGNLIAFGYNAIILAVLLHILLKTFNKRKLSIVAVMSILVIFIAIATQLLLALREENLFSNHSELVLPFMHISSFSWLCTIFVTLALSWIKENDPKWDNEISIDAFLGQYGDDKLVFLNALEGQLKQGKTAFVIATVIAWLSEIEKNDKSIFELLKENHDNLILQFSRINTINYNYKKGHVNINDHDTQSNVITSSVQEIIKEIKNKLPKDPSV